jgi:hypothetical protein
MALHSAIAGIMVKHGFMATRPTGKKLILNRNMQLYMISPRRVEVARFSASDILADDWTIVPIPENTLIVTPEK